MLKVLLLAKQLPLKIYKIDNFFYRKTVSLIMCSKIDNASCFVVRVFP